MKTTYYVATSKDGFIAKENGDVAWLDSVTIDQNEAGLNEFFSSVDGLVMGRKTYDFVFDYGSWPYEDKKTWVLSSREMEVLKGANLSRSENVNEVIHEAHSLDMEHLWLVGGGVLASEFVKRGLLNQVFVTELPVNLGRGIPLFANKSIDDLPIVNREVIQKNGFRQIKLVLSE